MTTKKRKDSCTFKREISLEIQERIYPLGNDRLARGGTLVSGMDLNREFL